MASNHFFIYLKIILDNFVNCVVDFDMFTVNQEPRR